MVHLRNVRNVCNVQIYGLESTNLWVEVFKKWAALRNIGEDMEKYEVQELEKFTIYLTNKFCPR